MKKILIPALVAVAAFAFKTIEDACDKMLIFKEGSSTTMTSYDAKGKIEGTSKTTYTNVTKTGDAVTVKGNSERFDKKGKSEGKTDLTFRCKNGSFYMDMRVMIPPQQMQQGGDPSQMTIETTEMEFPADLKEGMTLPDASFSMKSNISTGAGNFSVGGMNMRSFNRKVEKKESITTPAGTFDCYKITSDHEMKMMFTMKGKSVTWFSYEAGTVKTESYDNKGNLQGSTLLTEMVKK